MAEFPRGALGVAVEIGQIASAPASIAERAEALLRPLRRVVPLQAARIALLDPERRRSVTLVSQGYGGAVRAYFDSPAEVEEIQQLGLTRSRRPILLRDLPVPPSEVRGWAEFLEPAGFREGLAVGLFSADGRFLGFLGLNTDTAAHPTDAARDLIGAMAPMIANAVDPMRSIAAAARIVRGAEAGVVLTRGGEAQPLPGLAAHPLLHPGSAVLTVAAEQVATGRMHGAFLCPYGEAGFPDGHLRVTVLGCPPAVPHYLSAIVVLAPPGNLSRLTNRELQLLGLLVEGWSNRRIASALIIAQRTVAAHVEHILAKLGAPTRTAAVVQALQRGLYVPRPLVRVWGD